MKDVDHFLMCREWRAVRMQALERDGGRCACCGKTAADGITLNVDHIKPRIRYPELALTLDNLQVLCDVCNHGKGNKYETQWRQPSDQKPDEQDSVLADLQAGIEQRKRGIPTGTPAEEMERQRQVNEIARLQQLDIVRQAIKKSWPGTAL